MCLGKGHDTCYCDKHDLGDTLNCYDIPGGSLEDLPTSVVDKSSGQLSHPHDKYCSVHKGLACTDPTQPVLLNKNTKINIPLPYTK